MTNRLRFLYRNRWRISYAAALLLMVLLMTVWGVVLPVGDCSFADWLFSSGPDCSGVDKIHWWVRYAGVFVVSIFLRRWIVRSITRRRNQNQL